MMKCRSMSKKVVCYQNLAVRELLETSGLTQRKYVVLYKNTQDFVNELKKFQQHKDLSVLSNGETVEEIVLSDRLEGKKAT